MTINGGHVFWQIIAPEGTYKYQLVLYNYPQNYDHIVSCSEGSCRVLTDICVPSGAIICQHMHHCDHSSAG